MIPLYGKGLLNDLFAAWALFCLVTMMKHANPTRSVGELCKEHTRALALLIAVCSTARNNWPQYAL
jgi:hypothetical protein